ncbi:hypothetical protein JCM33374_g158 [Metschnikowia sp. JCM 33374]|nr:hypothetical protein JCM33374_g158 [Metschnikowia sp. JCM 33374]
MPGGIPPTKAASKTKEDIDQQIPPPPFSLTGAGAAAIAANKVKSLTRPGGNSQVSPNQDSSSFFSHQTASYNAILEPKPGHDVVALIFVFLSLPQSLSCLVLVSYILSGSFKSLAGKYIARYFLQSNEGIEFNLEAHSKTCYSYYRSELLGEFLQLFSINSFILLICHYTLPREWFQYLIVLAKSIIASRLVGTYATGSTTYVSVVSNNASNTGCVTTTTTTNNGQNAHLNGATKSESRSIPSSFANFITGFSFVVAANYIKDRMSNLSTSAILEDLSRLFSILSSQNSDLDGHTSGSLSDTLISTPSIISSNEFMSSKKSTYYIDNMIFSSKVTWANKFFFQLVVRYFGLGENSIQRLSFILREASIIINFAYLVLCIHVISLTISPYLQRILILKDYSKTLDHLSCLTPDVPYGGFKKGGLISSLPREASSESVVVINIDQPRAHSSVIPGPYEIKLTSQIAEKPLQFPLGDSKTSITAENFKTFCMKPPSTKTPVAGSKQSQNRTIVDRQRSNSTTTPSTTIMDKYFIISTQPIWTWLAAIKVLIVEPLLFSGISPRNESMDIYTVSRENLDLALVSADDSKIVFQLMDLSRLENLKSSLSVRVNGVSWMFVDVYTLGPAEAGVDKVYIGIYGLSASRQFEIEFFEKESPLGFHAVSTTSRGKSTPLVEWRDSSAIGLLQSSLIDTISNLSEARALFRKSKRDESKRVADLKRQIDVLKSKIYKYGVTQSNEGRIGSKLKGLQNSVTQLENETKEIERQIFDLKDNNDNFEVEYQSEELNLESQIAELESSINEYEQNTSRMRSVLKSADVERLAAEAKLKKTESKLVSKRDEIAKLNGEIKGLKNTLTSKIQKRQKRIHDRIERIIPKIMETSVKLSEELKGYSNGIDEVG